MRFVKPLDEELVLTIAARHRALVTIEENVIAGRRRLAPSASCWPPKASQLPLLHIGIPDRFIEHGSREDCLAAAGLDAAELGASVERWWALQPGAPASASRAESPPRSTVRTD